MNFQHHFAGTPQQSSDMDGGLGGSSTHTQFHQQFINLNVGSNYINARNKRNSSKLAKPVMNNFMEPVRSSQRKASLSSSKKQVTKNQGSLFSNKRNSAVVGDTGSEFIEKLGQSGSAQKKKNQESEFLHQFYKGKETASVSQSMPYFQFEGIGSTNQQIVLGGGITKQPIMGSQSPGSNFAGKSHYGKPRTQEITNSTISSLHEFTKSLSRPFQHTTGIAGGGSRMKQSLHYSANSTNDYINGQRKKNRAQSNLAHYIKGSQAAQRGGSPIQESPEPDLPSYSSKKGSHKNNQVLSKYHTLNSNSNYAKHLEKLKMSNFKSIAQGKGISQPVEDSAQKKGGSGKKSHYSSKPILKSNTMQPGSQNASRSTSQASIYRSHSGRKKPHIMDSSTLAARKKSGNFLDTSMDKFHSQQDFDPACKISQNLEENLLAVSNSEPADIMTDNKFSFYKEAFNQVIEQNQPFRDVLERIKQAYEDKLSQVINEKRPEKIFNSSPSTYELLQEELISVKENLEQESSEKQALGRRVEEMGEEITRLHSFCDSQDLYLKQLKDKNEVLKKQIIQAKMTNQGGGAAGGASELLNELEHLYEKCNQQQQLLGRYKEELKRSKNQELIYMSILKKENEHQQPQSTATNSMYFASPTRPIYSDMRISPNPKSGSKKEARVPHVSLVENNFNDIKPKQEEEEHPRAASAMRVDQMHPGFYEKEELNRKYSYSPEPGAIGQPKLRKKVLIPKLDFSKLKEGHKVEHRKKVQKQQTQQNQNIPLIGEKGKQNGLHIPNSTFTIQDLLYTDSKASTSAGLNLKRTNEFPSKEKKYDIFSKHISPTKPKNNRNQDLSPYDFTGQSVNKTNYSSSECSENMLNSSKSNPKPVIPKINPGFITKKISQKQKPTCVPNLVSKISQIKNGENVCEAPKGFHQEFMENFQEFSESWRKQTRHMQRRFSQQP